MGLSEWWKVWDRGVQPLIDPNPDVEGELSAKFKGPMAVIPTNRTEVYRTYGNPGVAEVDPAWRKANLVDVRGLPGRWNKGNGKLYDVHRLAEPYLREALRRAALVPWEPLARLENGLLHPRFGGVALDYIARLGCWNFRHQRHDTSRPLSYHSWGIAVDINADDNAGWYVSDVEPWDAKWRAHYPRGIPKELVRAFESVGWRWGGRWKGFVDPMHFELVQ